MTNQESPHHRPLHHKMDADWLVSDLEKRKPAAWEAMKACSKSIESAKKCLIACDDVFRGMLKAHRPEFRVRTGLQGKPRDDAHYDRMLERHILLPSADRGGLVELCERDVESIPQFWYGLALVLHHRVVPAPCEKQRMEQNENNHRASAEAARQFASIMEGFAATLHVLALASASLHIYEHIDHKQCVNPLAVADALDASGDVFANPMVFMEAARHSLHTESEDCPDWNAVVRDIGEERSAKTMMDHMDMSLIHSIDDLPDDLPKEVREELWNLCQSVRRANAGTAKPPKPGGFGMRKGTA